MRASLIRSAHSYCIDMIIIGFYLDFSSYRNAFRCERKFHFQYHNNGHESMASFVGWRKKREKKNPNFIVLSERLSALFRHYNATKASLCFVCLIKLLVVFSFVVRHSNRDHICVYWFLIYLLRSVSHSKPLSLVEFSRCVWIFNGIINIQMKNRWWWL